jgi:outer membrane protein assembly factor BamB
MVAGGELFFAAWSPGDPSEDSEFKMPTFDDLLKSDPGGDANKDGVLAKEETKGSQMEGFFDGNDFNKDGRLTRDEWESMINFMASSKNSAFALKPGGSGDISESHVRWKKTRGLPYVSSAIVYEGQLVMAKDGGIVTAYDVKTGNELYQRRALAEGTYYSSPVAANGHIYFGSLEDGAITVLKAGSPSPEVVMKNPPLGEKLAATPAIVGDTMYVRTAGHLYAFAAK